MDSKTRRASPKRLYLAIKDGKKIAEADSLDSLSTTLAKLRIDLRDIMIESVPPLPKKVRIGARMTSRIQMPKLSLYNAAGSAAKERSVADMKKLLDKLRNEDT